MLAISSAIAACFLRGDRPRRFNRLATTCAIGVSVGKTDEQPLDIEEEPAMPTASSNTSDDVDRERNEETVVENSSEDCLSE